MNREKPTLLLVIPAFNEEQVLEKKYRDTKQEAFKYDRKGQNY